MSVGPPTSCRATSEDQNQLGLLNTALIEITYTLIHGNVNNDLVANASVVYNKDRGWGIFWDYFHWAFARFADVPNARTAQLQDNLRNIKRMYNTQLRRLHRVAEVYERCLNLLCADKNPLTIDEEGMNLYALHHEIINWYNATSFFTRYINQDPSHRKKIDDLYAKLDPCVEGKEREFPFNDPSFPLMLYRSIIQIHSHLDKTPPFAIMGQIARNIPITSMSTERLDAWVKELNEKFGSAVEINDLHFLCEVIARHAPGGSKDVVADTFRLEHYLHHRYNQLFSRVSPCYVNWRDHLATGNPIFFNATRLTLSRRVVQTTEWVAFEILGDTSHTIWIGQNAVINRLHHKFCESCREQPVPFAPIMDISGDNGIAMVKRLVPIEDKWKVKDQKEKLSTSAYQAIIRQLSFLIAHLGRKINFSSDDLYCQEDTGELRLCLSSINKNLVKIIQVEDIEGIIAKIAGEVPKMAGGDPKDADEVTKVAGEVARVTKMLREATGLQDHKITHFYKAIVTKIQEEGDKFDRKELDILMNIREVLDCKLNATALHFAASIREIFEACVTSKEKEENKRVKGKKDAIAMALLQRITVFGITPLMTRDLLRRNQLIEDIAKEALDILSKIPPPSPSRLASLLQNSPFKGLLNAFG